MCKVLAVAGVKKEHQAKIKMMAKAAAKEFQYSDGDGFGYAAITRKGLIYGEKWLNKDDVMTLHQNRPKPKGLKLIESILGKAAKLTEYVSEETYGSFGVTATQEVIDDTVGFMFHARKKTIGEKSVANTHPFFSPGDEKLEPTALIHNGSIDNHEKLTKIYSSCDSEVILHEYVGHFLNYVPANITNVAEKLIGEYTSVVLSRYMDDEGHYVPYMDIFKSNKDLCVGYVKDIDSLVYCTNKYALEGICKECGFTVENITEVEDGFLIRLDAVTGDRIDELVSFNKSQKKDFSRYPLAGSTQKDGTSTSTHTPHNNKLAVLNDVRTKYEKRHPEPFSSDYVGVAAMTAEDVSYLREFEKSNSNKMMRTLILVKHSIAK